MQARPNLFLIGGPKCGTTAFVSLLKQHSKIKWSKHKEIDFFCKDIKILYKLSKAKNTKEYLKRYYNFKKKDYKYFGDGSPFYLYSDVAVRNIIKFNPNSKFIVLIRNPISMAFTLHNQLAFEGREKEKNFIKAWKLQKIRKKSKHGDKNYNKYNEIFQYKSICSLGTQLKKVKKIIKPQNLLILSYKEFNQNYEKVLKRTFNFLKIKNEKIKSSQKNISRKLKSDLIYKIASSNFSKVLRNKITKLLAVKSLGIGRPIKLMDYETKKLLKIEFRKELQILRKLNINV